MKILITGAAGFIGSHLINSFKERDYIYILVRKRGQLKKPANCKVIEMDLSKPLQAENLPSELDVIIHLAQANVCFPERANRLFRVNTVSTQELLDYGRRIGIKTFIFTSSGSVYGSGNEVFKEEYLPRIGDFYSLSKYTSELLIGQYTKFFNTVILRLFVPYGKNQKGRLIPGLIERIKMGQKVTIYNEGNPRINPIYISDLLEIFKKSLYLKGNFLFNVGGERIYSIKEIAQIIGEVLDKKVYFKYISDRNKKDIIGDISLMKSLLDFTPQVTLKEGIKRIL